MAKKVFNRRVLAILMSVVMLVGMIPLQVSANAQQVMDGYFVLDENGTVTDTTHEHSHTEHGFTVSKTAVSTGENQFDITLTVQTSQTVTSSNAAIQLVIDRSNSMARCASCGSERSCSCNAGTRMAAVKNAIAGKDGFLDSLTKNNSGKVFLSVVTFSTYAETVMEWTDITTAAGLNAAKNAINGIRVDGGTNLEAGLMLARNRLGMDAIATCSSKYTVLLTDGAPTYYVSGNSTDTNEIDSYSGSGSSASEQTISGAAEAAAAAKEKSILFSISYGVAEEILSSSSETFCANCEKTLEEHNAVRVNNTSRPRPGNNRTVYYCSGESGDTWQQGETVRNELTVGQFLSNSIATSADKAYDAADIDGVNAAFASVCDSAVEGMTGAGTAVTDPMGKFVVLGDVSQVKGVSASENVLSWTLDESTLISTTTKDNTTTYTYQITYPITLDTAAKGFQENVYYPANGYTCLSVAENGTVKKIPFYIPGIQGTLPQLGYKVNYFLQGDAAAGDYANYTFATADQLGPVKAWTNVEAPVGYSVKFADQNYAFAYGITAMVVTPDGENEMNLYYNRIIADVTVNHFYKTDVTDSNGKVTEGVYSETPDLVVSESVFAGENYSAVAQPVFAGNTYTLESAKPGQLIVVSAEGSNVVNLYYTRMENTYSYTVNYDGNGGALESGDTRYTDSESTGETYATTHTAYADENTFARANYTFLGWAEQADGQVVYAAGDVIALTAQDSSITLYAIWEEDPKYVYGVIYNEGYGEDPAVVYDSENKADIYETSYSITVDENMFTRENYTFLGWAERLGGNVVYTAGDVIDFTFGGSKILYAVWEENTKYSYSVIYNEGYGENPAELSDAENKSDIYNTSYSITVDENTFTRENHQFLGWAEQLGGDVVYTVGDVIDLTFGGSKILYAVWEENAKYSYSVIYNAGYGEDPAEVSDSENKTDIYDTEYGISVDWNNFVRENYTFVGWAESAGGEVAYEPGELIVFYFGGAKTLYAVWEENAKYSYSVIYNEGYGENPAELSDSENKSDIYNTSYSIIVDENTFIRENYQFLGWAESASGEVVYAAGDVIAFELGGSKTLYAVWEEDAKYSYGVIYNEGYGETPAELSDSENKNDIYDTSYSITVDENTFTRDNYTFLGWAEQVDGQVVYAAGDVIAFELGGSKTLYAVWVENTLYSYSVAYNGNGGQLLSEETVYSDAENVESVYDETYEIMVDANAFLYENHTFLGWAESIDGEVVYQPGDIIAFQGSGAKILYAVWEEAPKYDYSVIYNANFGEDPETAADAQNVQGVYAQVYTIDVDANMFTRPSYSFTGWNTDPAGNGTAYSAEEAVELTRENNAVILYAQWILNDYAYTVEYFVSIDDGEYTAFAGTLPVSAPVSGEAPYGAVIDKAYLDVLGLPVELTEDGLIYRQVAVDGITVSEEENVVKVYYNVVLDEIVDENPPLAENPKTADSVVFAAAAALVSGAGIVGVISKKKKEDGAEEEA